MTSSEAEYLDQLAAATAEKVVAALRQERDDRPLLSVEDAAEKLGVSRRNMYTLIGSHEAPGVLRSVTIGRRRMVVPQDLDAYVASRREDRSDD